MSRGWWSNVEGPVLGGSAYRWDGALTDIARVALFQQVMNGSEVLAFGAFRGEHADGNESGFKQISELLQARGGRLLVERVIGDLLECPCIKAFAWESALVRLNVDPEDDNLVVDVVTADSSILEFVADKIAPLLRKRDLRGSIYSLTKQSHGYDVRRMGHGGSSIEHTNYTAATMQQFDRVVAAIGQSNNWRGGRLVLLEGLPGTGKTYMVEGITEAVEALFIMVRAEMLSSLDGPELLPTLMDQHRKRKGKPMVFIVEDADGCLLPRGSDNMAAIRALLNYTDGIPGRSLNAWVVATSNAKKVEMDKALLRNRRMCEHIRLGPLEPDHANAVLARLTEGVDLSEVRWSGEVLADIYEIAEQLSKAAR